eukprot:4926633-Pleurochrysis_carterae.AAC.2
MLPIAGDVRDGLVLPLQKQPIQLFRGLILHVSYVWTAACLLDFRFSDLVPCVSMISDPVRRPASQIGRRQNAAVELIDRPHSVK